jgi:hypothetical protein
MKSKPAQKAVKSMGNSQGPSLETPKEIIENIAIRKGTVTEAFKKRANEEAKEGRRDLLRLIQGSEEIRDSYSKALEM